MPVLAQDPPDQEEDFLPEGDADVHSEEEPARAEPKAKPKPRPPAPEPAKPAPEPEPVVEEAPPPPPPKPLPQLKPQSFAPAVAVWLIPSKDSLRSLALQLGARASRRLAKVEELPAAELAERIAPSLLKAQEEEVQLGLSGVQEGIDAFEGLDLETAGASFDISVGSLLGYYSKLSQEQRNTLYQGIFAYGATTLFEGRSEEADRFFVALLLLSPDFNPVAERYPSNVIQRYQRVKDSLAERNQGQLVIETTPPGAEVFIDGVARGRTPLTVNELADGYHSVVLSQWGRRPMGTLAPVDGQATSNLELELEPLAETEALTAALDLSLSDGGPKAMAWAKKLGLSKVALLSLSENSLGPRVSGVWLDVKTGQQIAKLAPTKLVTDPELAAETVVQAIKGAEAAEILSQQKVEEPFEMPKFLKEWWFWAAVGGAAALAGGSVALVAASDNGPQRPPSQIGVLGF